MERVVDHPGIMATPPWILGWVMAMSIIRFMEHPKHGASRRAWLQQVCVGAGAVAGLGATLGLSGCARRDPAPDVDYVELNGRAGRLSALRGKVVLVNFWATSCATCVAEMPDLIATHQRHHPKGYETLAVAMSYDPPAYVASFAERRQLPFPVAIDNTGEIARAFGDVRLTPTTFLLDKQSRIVKRYVGTPDFKALDRLILDLLGET